MTRRRWLVLVVLVIASAAAVVLYPYLRGREYILRLSEADLRASLAERLPFTRTYLAVAEVTLDEPRIRLDEGSDRVTAGLDVIVSLSGSTRPITLRGTVDASSGLRYEPDSGEFFLVDPVIQQVSVQGVPDRYTARVNDALAWALAEYYRGRAVYRLRATDIRHAPARLLLKDVTVVDQELVVTLGL